MACVNNQYFEFQSNAAKLKHLQN